MAPEYLKPILVVTTKCHNVLFACQKMRKYALYLVVIFVYAHHAGKNNLQTKQLPASLHKGALSVEVA